MLFVQYPSRRINGQCIPDLQEDYPHVGGYAESTGQSASGPWLYNYFQSAYSSNLKFVDAGERGANATLLGIRKRPRVVLGPDGGLDGGYIVNQILEADGESFPAVQQVSRSVLWNDLNQSGMIYIVYHAETENPIYPFGIGELGMGRARHLAKIFQNFSYEIPRTIIGGPIEDLSGRGQRMVASVSPLAESLGIPVLTGPRLLDDPGWTPVVDHEYAMMALKALKEGPVLLSYWSHVDELCNQLNTQCDDFQDYGEMLVLDVKNGMVESVERMSDRFVTDENAWESLPTNVRANLLLLGNNESNWEDTKDGVFESIQDDRKWEMLDKIQRVAAENLGYDEKSWNSNKKMMLSGWGSQHYTLYDEELDGAGFP